MQLQVLTVKVYIVILAKYGDMGDYRFFTLYFCSISVLGNVFPQIVPQSTNTLHCDSKQIQRNYHILFNNLCNHHQLFWKLNEIDKIVDFTTAAEFKAR